jgi:Rne/Rng family ribonuclease
VIEEQAQALAAASVELPQGGRLHIQPTAALVAIDVDAGAAVGARQGKTAAHLGANRTMLPELARQIRLRNLSGAILVDFAGLPTRRRTALGPALEHALAEDPVRPRLLGFTALGLAEIVRPRIHPPLHELLARTAGGIACRGPGGFAVCRGRSRGASAASASIAGVARDRQRAAERCGGAGGPCAACRACLDAALGSHTASDGLDDGGT